MYWYCCCCFCLVFLSSLRPVSGCGFYACPRFDRPDPEWLAHRKISGCAPLPIRPEASVLFTSTSHSPVFPLYPLMVFCLPALWFWTKKYFGLKSIKAVGAQIKGTAVFFASAFHAGAPFSH